MSPMQNTVVGRPALVRLLKIFETCVGVQGTSTTATFQTPAGTYKTDPDQPLQRRPHNNNGTELQHSSRCGDVRGQYGWCRVRAGMEEYPGAQGMACRVHFGDVDCSIVRVLAASSSQVVR